MQIGGTSQSGNQATNSATSMSQAITYGREATNSAVTSAERANELAMANWREAAAFNSAEAEKQRQWQERMANTVYQRSMKDMLAAGLNPVLAAGGGLGSAAVSGGATASIPSASTYMANTYPESQSASNSQSQGQSSGWSESLSGLAYLADAISGLIGATNSANQINISLEGLENLINPPAATPKNYDEKGKSGGMEDSVEGLKQVKNGTESFGNWLLNELNPFNGPLANDLRERTKNAKKYLNQKRN